MNKIQEKELELKELQDNLKIQKCADAFPELYTYLVDNNYSILAGNSQSGEFTAYKDLDDNFQIGAHINLWSISEYTLQVGFLDKHDEFAQIYPLKQFGVDSKAVINFLENPTELPTKYKVVYSGSYEKHYLGDAEDFVQENIFYDSQFWGVEVKVYDSEGTLKF